MEVEAEDLLKFAGRGGAVAECDEHVTTDGFSYWEHKWFSVFLVGVCLEFACQHSC